jgi:hypothetical protein
VGRRARREQRLKAPNSDYRDPEGNLLTLRGSLTAGARREYSDLLTARTATAAATREDLWQRALELLFERLAVRWVISEVPLERQQDLLARLRLATVEERAWVRETLRAHCAEYFPELQAP